MQNCTGPIWSEGLASVGRVCVDNLRYAAKAGSPHVFMSAIQYLIYTMLVAPIAPPTTTTEDNFEQP
eukprot:12400958-Karenia_brevis.AAC.1